MVNNLKIMLRRNSYGVLTLINKLELLDRLTKNCEQNSFAEGKSASFSLVSSFRQMNRNSKRSETKVENSRGEGGLAILEFRGQGGDKHFGISQGKGGLKYSCHPW